MSVEMWMYIEQCLDRCIDRSTHGSLYTISTCTATTHSHTLWELRVVCASDGSGACGISGNRLHVGSSLSINLDASVYVDINPTTFKPCRRQHRCIHILTHIYCASYNMQTRMDVEVIMYARMDSVLSQYYTDRLKKTAINSWHSLPVRPRHLDPELHHMHSL